MVTHDESVGRLADRRLNLEHGRIREHVVFSAEENEDFDEVLEHLWTRTENIDHLHATEYTEVQWRKLTTVMAAIGLVTLDSNGEAKYTREGEERARTVIRRHRLAERLFVDVLSIRDDHEVEESACKFEHILSPEVTDKMCTLLGHPKACPHGSPIPPGDCCKQSDTL